MSHSRNGQIFTMDIIASLLIFMLILNLSLMTWNVVERNSVMFNEERELRDRVNRVGDLLVRTPGHPEDWDAGTVEIIGFTSPDHVLDGEKLDEFDSLSYTDQKELMRTRQSDFHLNVSSNGTTVSVDTGSGDLELVYGLAPADDAETVAVDRRRVLVNASGTPGLNRSTLELVFWR